MAPENDALPPLNAGADAQSLPPLPDISEMETKEDGGKAPIESSDNPSIPQTSEPSKNTDIADDQDGSGETDDEILKAFSKTDGDSGTEAKPSLPEGVTEEEWNAFQAYKAQQAQVPNQEQAKPEESAPPELGELTPEDYDGAFESVDGFKNAIGKAAGHAVKQAEERMYNNVREALVHFNHDILSKMEQMLYVNEALREHPEIASYPDAFRVAYAKSFKNAKNGDLKTPVMEAVKTFKRELGRYQAISKTMERVDVRGKQQAPRSPGASSRNVHQSQSKDQDDGLSFISSLM